MLLSIQIFISDRNLLRNSLHFKNVYSDVFVFEYVVCCYLTDAVKYIVLILSVQFVY